MTGEPDSFRNRYELAAARALRRSRSGSLRQYAEALRVALDRPVLSAASIHQWEKGVARIPADVLIAAANIAGVSLDNLIAEATAPAEPVPQAPPDAVALIAAARMLDMPVEELLQAIDRGRKSPRRRPGGEKEPLQR